MTTKLLIKDRDGKLIKKIPIERAARIKTDELRLYIEPMNTGIRLVWSMGLVPEMLDVGSIEFERT